MTCVEDRGRGIGVSTPTRTLFQHPRRGVSVVGRWRFHAADPSRSPFRVEAVGTGGLLPGVDLDDSAALLDATEGR